MEVKEIIHDLPEDQKICFSCGELLTKIGENVTEKITYIPSKLIKTRHITPIYKCVTCSNLDIKAKIVSSPYDLAFPKAMVDSSFISHIIVEKFMKYVPLYRQEKFFNNVGLEITRTNMSNWLVSAYHYLEPLFHIMHEDLLEKDIVLMDETTLQVIQSDKSTSYIWMANTSKYDTPIHLYFYKDTREYKHAGDILNGFKGKYIQSDCYGAYDRIPGVVDCCCLAHAKRKYTDIIKISGGKYQISESTCKTAVEFIQKLYSIEKDLKGRKASIEEIYQTRQEKSIPILKEYENWLDNTYPLFAEKSKVGQALYYSLHNIKNLSNYCLDGRIDSMLK